MKADGTNVGLAGKMDGSSGSGETSAWGSSGSQCEAASHLRCKGLMGDDLAQTFWWSCRDRPLRDCGPKQQRLLFLLFG